MDVAVCEVRAVVEHKFRRIFPELLNLFIEADFLPMLYARGFAFYKVAAHGELRIRQV